MLALIIAAGFGNRLGALTRDRPKALVPVLERELILRALDFTDHPAVTERLVITGYEGEKLASFLRKQRPDVHLVHNPDYRDGSIRTIETALPHVHQDFLLMNVDHIYPRRMLMRILGAAKGVTAVCDFDRSLGPDDMKVKLDEHGRLQGIRKTLEVFDGGYIGMSFCAEEVQGHYREGVAKARQSEGDTASVEAALAHLVRKPFPVNICDVSGIQWLEVDTPEDLAHAEEKLRMNPELL